MRNISIIGNVIVIIACIAAFSDHSRQLDRGVGDWWDFLVCVFTAIVGTWSVGQISEAWRGR